MRRKRCAVYALALACLTALPGTAAAQDAAPTPEQIAAAAEAFDRGRDAYKAERFTEAAEQFERADSNAPSATALELAIRARDRAGDLDRAATLALLAIERYASEVQNEESGIGKIAPAILERARAELYELDVRCSEPCQLVDGKKLVHGEPVVERVIFLSPGEHQLIAGFGEGRTQTQTVTATAGASGEVLFEAPAAPPPQAEPEPADIPPEPEPVAPPPPKSSGWSPVVFFVGAGLTVAMGGVTVWSGLDTVNNPGEERVRRECARGDTSCSLYKQGQAKELRTNVLIGVTGGLAVATALVGGLAVDWGGSEHADSAAGLRSIRPMAGWANGPTFAARGRF